MFKSIYADQLSQYYTLRSKNLSDSAKKHELCYLKRFDKYVYERLSTYERLDETFISEWISSLSGKSSSIENEVIVIRQFLSYLRFSGKYAFIPPVPKVHEDYVPYIFSDAELERIFDAADNVIQKDLKTDPYLVIEFPVIIRLLYSSGLRIGETLRIDMSDVDLENGILKLLNTKGSVLKVPKKKAPRQGRSSFTREEVKILFEIPDARSEIGIRDKNLLCL